MDFETCSVCGRSILRGERCSGYVDSDRTEHRVCPLCKPRAEELGWLPAAFAAAAPEPEPRRRGGGVAALRDRFERAVGVAAPEPADPGPPPTPLEVFNASPEVRKVAGLIRSLGEPRVCVRAEDGAELIVVAWDLSWYRWSVRGTSVKQVAKGNEISELPVEDRDWNATASDDGTLTRD